MTKERANKYPKAFRQMALERMKSCENVSALAKELGVDRTVLYHWWNLTPGEDGATANSPVRELRKEIRDPLPVPPDWKQNRKGQSPDQNEK